MFTFFKSDTLSQAASKPANWEVLPDKKAPAPSLLPAAERDHQSVMEEFSRSLDDLNRAILKNRNAGKLLDEFKNKGTLGSLLHTFTGRNDKEMASIVEDLGSSLGTTQLVVQVLIQLQTRKNVHLRGFHDALVEKIAALKRDAQTLEQNQEDVALSLLQEIDSYVSEQIALSDAMDEHTVQIRRTSEILAGLQGYVERQVVFHQGRLDDLGAALEAAHKTAREQSEAAGSAMHSLEDRVQSQLALHEQRSTELKTALQALLRASREQGQATGEALNRLRATGNDLAKALKSVSEDAAASRTTHAAEIKRLELEQSRLDQLVDALRIGIEGLGQRQSFVKTQGLPLLALLVAGVAIALQFISR